MENMTKISEDTLGAVAGGNIGTMQYDQIYGTNFCPKCRNSGHKYVRTDEEGYSIHKCPTCGLEFRYRNR